MFLLDPILGDFFGSPLSPLNGDGPLADLLDVVFALLLLGDFDLLALVTLEEDDDNELEVVLLSLLFNLERSNGRLLT